VVVRKLETPDRGGAREAFGADTTQDVSHLKGLRRGLWPLTGAQRQYQ
jgi:hypothetical protein